MFNLSFDLVSHSHNNVDEIYRVYSIKDLLSQGRVGAHSLNLSY